MDRQRPASNGGWGKERIMARGLLLSIAAGASIFAAMAHLTQASANPLVWFGQPLFDFGPAAEARSEVQMKLRRRLVEYPTKEPPGTVIIETSNTYLCFVVGRSKAIRYATGVGREGFTWSGVKIIERKAMWPDWTPPPEMIARSPYLPRFMAGGEGNPLGARAMYLSGSMYRIHGTNAPLSIGIRATAGCNRMTNEDVIDLYDRVTIGTRVVALSEMDHRLANR
jgi:lipoprotein-anchoring transpeptidase ErfK/SrfK